MLKIRLQRTGRKHEPTFRVVLTDSKNSTKSGRYLEVLGSHDARHKDLTLLKEDRIKHWISKGAQVSDTLHNMFLSKKIIEGKKINVLPKRTYTKPEEAPVAEAPAPVEAPVEETKAEVAPEAPAETPAEAPAETPAA